MVVRVVRVRAVVVALVAVAGLRLGLGPEAPPAAAARPPPNEALDETPARAL